ncbi:DUF6123 family protein [Pontibacillus salipaludis]|uniref:Uncharacterized protein n=1 Tax=Pontibacillus salipaludis TaxID=1697394 RepID=A0ABQ1PLB3_9BACI|nr:DUF6123 family protein [Pontibacillus salipaludis]GGC99090.1 hypothetical protein GCM10011389_02900 [Pontibacillus salipaludis]
MPLSKSLGYFIEDLWSKGFRLKDKDIHFIYFGKNYTNSEDWLVIFALKITIQFQMKFDGSFFIGVLEYLQENHPRTKRDAWILIEQKGLYKRRKPHSLAK